MAKYHISPTTGRPNKCNATQRACPVGGEHYPSKEAAQQAYEAGQNAVPAGRRKAPAEAYDSYDQPLKGTGTGPGGREATRERLANRPHLSYERVDTPDGFATEVHANGELAFTVERREEEEAVQRAMEAGQWVKLRELMELNDAAVGDLSDVLSYPNADIHEEAAEREDTLAATMHDPKDPKPYAYALHDAEVGRMAVAVLKAEAKARR